MKLEPRALREAVARNADDLARDLAPVIEAIRAAWSVAGIERAEFVGENTGGLDHYSQIVMLRRNAA